MGVEMTREERKEYVKQFYIPIVWGKIDKLVDEIYSDVEARTCESCKHYKAENKQCVNEASIAFTSQEAIYTDDGCNKWEQK